MVTRQLRAGLAPPRQLPSARDLESQLARKRQQLIGQNPQLMRISDNSVDTLHGTAIGRLEHDRGVEQPVGRLRPLWHR